MVHRQGMMVPRVALLNSHGLEREGEAAARKSCLRSCLIPLSFSPNTNFQKGGIATGVIFQRGRDSQLGGLHGALMRLGRY
jgi:hypothetical protein